MREEPGRPSDVEVMVACDWCGARESLPADVATRVRVLRIKAAERHWAEEATRGPALALARILAPGASGLLGSVTSGLKAMMALMLAGGAIVLLGRGASGLAQSPLLLALAPIAAALVGTTLGFHLARRQILPAFIPLLTAAPPPQPGALLRCRRCGADLPGSHHAFVDCAHCRAANLVTERALSERALLLEDATARQRRAGRDNRAMVERATRRVSAWLSGGLVSGILLGVGLAMFLAHSLT
jgi:hypothetical protein